MSSAHVGVPGRHDDRAGVERDPRGTEAAEELFARWSPEDDRAVALAEPHHRAVLGHDRIEHREVDERDTQVVEDASGDEQRDDAGLPGGVQRRRNLRREMAVGRTRAVVVAGDRAAVHRHFRFSVRKSFPSDAFLPPTRPRSRELICSKSMT